MSSATNSTPFVISHNLIEDSDYGVLLGWFGYANRLGPMNCVVSNNVVRRVRMCGIQVKATCHPHPKRTRPNLLLTYYYNIGAHRQNNGGPGAHDGNMIITGNQANLLPPT